MAGARADGALASRLEQIKTKERLKKDGGNKEICAIKQKRNVTYVRAEVVGPWTSDPAASAERAQ